MLKQCTYPILLPACVMDEMELIYVVSVECIDTQVSSCDVYVVSMSNWKSGSCSPGFCSVMSPTY